MTVLLLNKNSIPINYYNNNLLLDQNNIPINFIETSLLYQNINKDKNLRKKVTNFFLTKINKWNKKYNYNLNYRYNDIYNTLKLLIKKHNYNWYDLSTELYLITKKFLIKKLKI